MKLEPKLTTDLTGPYKAYETRAVQQPRDKAIMNIRNVQTNTHSINTQTRDKQGSFDVTAAPSILARAKRVVAAARSAHRMTR